MQTVTPTEIVSFILHNYVSAESREQIFSQISLTTVEKKEWHIAKDYYAIIVFKIPKSFQVQ